jgi:hypothetical protein
LEAGLSWKEGRLLLDGERALLMTDFQVKPPRLMLGALRTDDRVVVKFHLEIGGSGSRGEKTDNKEEL